MCVCVLKYIDIFLIRYLYLYIYMLKNHKQLINFWYQKQWSMPRFHKNRPVRFPIIQLLEKMHGNPQLIIVAHGSKVKTNELY